MTKAEIFAQLTSRAAETYAAKNHDYGDSFAKTRELIPNAILVRLHDKLNRVTSLLLKGEQKVCDESVEDTLLDLANYALMELTERIYERQVCEMGRELGGECHYEKGALPYDA